MAVAGLLAQYMAIKNQLSYYELQDTRWNDLAAAMTKKVSEQETSQSKYDDQSGSLYDSWGETKEFKAGGIVFQDKKGCHPNHIGVNSIAVCESYAHAKVPKFDAEKLDEYTNLDIEYQTMVNMYDTLIEELTAQADSLKEQLSTEAQDTHMLN